MINLRQEIVKQYVASLKEDSELDYIFPLLLERMGFRIISTPKQSKGQSQYGRDVIAIRKKSGVSTLYLIELKGFRAHDVNDRTLNEKDGLIESMRASKNTPYRDASIPGLDTYARKYVYVHNGTIDSNTVPTLDGFVACEFPDGNFERWDLDKLTQMFSKYLFEETLLTDDDSYRLFKKILVLLDSEGNNYSDIVALVDKQIEKVDCLGNKLNPRVEMNFFATLRLIGAMVYLYAEQADNLYPAKFCMDTIVVKTWAWILRNNLENRNRIKERFIPIVQQQIQVYSAYLNKIIDATGFEKGFFGFEPDDTELVFYPLRCFDFLNDLMYFFFATETNGLSAEEARGRKSLTRGIIEANTGFKMPLLDTHSIPIQLLFKYFLREPEKEDWEFMDEYLSECIVNVIKRHNETNMWPEMTGNRMALAKSIYEKSDEYGTASSLLLTVFLELSAYLDDNLFYEKLKTEAEKSEVSLQVAYPICDEYDIEQLLFEKRLYNELSVATDIKLPNSLDDFQTTYTKKYQSIQYRTDAAGFGFLRILAHKYYETDLFPDYLGRSFCSE